jgi:membrane protease YdiL (CAAX protease family)
MIQTGYWHNADAHDAKARENRAIATTGGTKRMTPRRLILSVLTIIVVILSIGPALIGSLDKPQITDRLQLYQTNLLLHASEIQVGADSDADLAPIRNALIENDPIKTALEQYQSIRQSTQQAIAANQAKLDQLEASDGAPLSVDPGLPPSQANQIISGQIQQVRSLQSQQQALLNRLIVRIGLLQAEQDNTAAALDTWNELIDDASTDADAEVSASADQESLVEVASVLSGLWSEPPRLLPDAEQTLQQQLEGWFRYVGLGRLYELQQRPDALEALRAQEQQLAQQAIVKLALVGTAPAIGCLIGAGLLIFLIIQRLVQGKQALLAGTNEMTWETPWTGIIVWQVLIVGFFFLGQIILPIVFSLMRAIVSQVLALQGVIVDASSGRLTAFSTLLIYIIVAAASLLVLYLSIKPYLPLPSDWFRARLRDRWVLWGLGGYFVALPLVIGISLVNQQIWQGRGGNNPLLEIVLRENDPLALSIFFVTAAIAAPVFEEILFRGFLLPSLTRYLPVWGAIALSAVIFATAHLSFSEILPLTVLGMVLGFVYVRSRNLLAPMLVHSLWNSATMIGLLVLGSSSM